MIDIGKQLLEFGERINSLGFQLERENGIYRRGYLDALSDVLQLPVKDFTGDFIDQIYQLKMKVEEE